MFKRDELKGAVESDGSGAFNGRLDAGFRQEAIVEPGRRRWLFLLLALGLLLIAAAVGLWLLQADRFDDGMEPNVIVGPMGDYSPDEIEELLNQKVDEGMIAFSINTQVVMESPDALAPLLFENPGNNGKLLKLVLTRDDTGEAVYETGFLAPGTYVEKDSLNARLEPGTYTCTATIAAFREDTRDPLGQAAAEVIVTVVDDSGQ